MQLIIDSLSYNHKLNSQFVLGPISVRSNNYLKITGSNGSGKTTFLKCVAGLLKPSYKMLSLDNESISSVLWVNAEASIYWETLLALDYIILQSSFYGTSKGMALSRLKNYKIDFLEQNIFSLSTGQKKILSIIAALISGCELLVLDEPESNLDKDNKILFYDLISKENGPFVLFSSHEITDILNSVKCFHLNSGLICDV